MTALEVHDNTRDRRGELVTVDDQELVFVEQTGPWVEVVPENGDCGFVEHESRVSSQ